jgi:hypothetical protein
MYLLQELCIFVSEFQKVRMTLVQRPLALRHKLAADDRKAVDEDGQLPNCGSRECCGAHRKSLAPGGFAANAIPLFEFPLRQRTDFDAAPFPGSGPRGYPWENAPGTDVRALCIPRPLPCVCIAKE